MKDIKVFESVIDNKIMNEMEEANWCTDLIQYATSKCKIDGMIATAYLFCPQIIQVGRYIFIKHFWNHEEEETAECIKILEEQYDNDKIIYQFGDAMVYFWKCRVKELFPDKKVVVELGKDLMGELGLCITMYQVD